MPVSRSSTPFSIAKGAKSDMGLRKKTRSNPRSSTRKGNR